MTNEFENPSNAKPITPKEDFSLPLEEQRKELTKFGELTQQIEEKKMLLLGQMDTRFIQILRAEIAHLEAERSEAEERADAALAEHKAETDMLEEFDPSDKDSGGRA